MLLGLRTWLAHLLMPELVVSQSAPALVAVAQPTSSPIARDLAPGKDHERAARRVHEAEDRVSRAEERARRAEAGRKAAEADARAATGKLEDVVSRARRAELQLKKEVDARARSGKGKRGKGEALESKLATAHERLSVALSRVSQVEREKVETEQQAKAVDAENGALTKELAEARAALAEASRGRAASAGTAGGAVAGAAAPESKHAGGVTRRDAPRTHLEAFFSPSDDCPSAIIRQIETAQRTLDVCVFTITDDRIANTMLDAHRRGVHVRIITDNDKAYDEGSDIRRLERAGIEVREDDSPFHMHHKFAIFDGRMMLTGSYNWTRGAARNNQENVVVSSDTRLIAAFDREFSSLWARFAKATA